MNIAIAARRPSEESCRLALSSANRYDRLTGYISARALALAARGVEGLIVNGGRMRLIVGCTLPEEEVAAIERGFDYFKASVNRVSASIKAGDHDYYLHVVELHNTGPTTAMTLAAFAALCSGVFGKPIQQQMVILGSMSLGGNIVPVENLAESLQVAFDAGAKRLLLPMANVKDIPTIPGELFAKFQTGFYADASDAVFKALGVG